MRRSCLALTLMAALSSGQATTPAPLNGIWKMTRMTPLGQGAVTLPSTELVIVGNQVRGHIGCGTYTGTIEAASNTMKIHVAPLPPQPNERCLYAVPGIFHGALNAAWGYIISGDTQRLVIFTKTAWLSFERIGYVTPAGK